MAYDIDRRPAVAHPQSDEMDGPGLDPRWVVLNGTPGRVNLTGTTGGIYDTESQPGLLLLQPGYNLDINLRRPLALADGESIVGKIRCACGLSATLDSTIDLGIAVANNDDWSNNAFATVHFDSEQPGGRIYMGDSQPVSGGFLANRVVPYLYGRHWYIRLLRAGSSYVPMWSPGGVGWAMGPTLTPQSAPDRLILFAQMHDALPGPLPIHAVEWLRWGGGGAEPW